MPQIIKIFNGNTSLPLNVVILEDVVHFFLFLMGNLK